MNTKVIGYAFKALALLGLLVSCNDESISSDDKVTRLMITQSNFIQLSSNDTSSVYMGYLTDFSIKDYKNVKSVKFVVIGACNNTEDKIFWVSIFDTTNNKKISGSEVRVEIDECNVTKYSQDIADKLPDGRVDLGIVVSGPDIGGLWGSYIYLYRN